MTMTMPTVGVGQFTDEFLVSLRMVGDPPADEAAQRYIDGPATASDLLVTLGQRARIEPDDEELPGLGSFVKGISEESWPSWANQEMVERGQHVFARWGALTGSSLFSASLPTDYCCWRGAQALARTNQLTQQPRRRILETGQLILDVMRPGGLSVDGNGSNAARHVRLMHAAVRHVLLHPHDVQKHGQAILPAWDVNELGVPISQEQLLGTLFSFNVVCLDALERIGATVSEDDAEAYVHAWNLVGHMMGIRNDLLPLNLADSREVFDRIRRLEWQRSQAGEDLIQAIIELDKQILHVHWPFNGFPVAGIRALAGDEVGDVLGLPPADWTKYLFKGLFHVDTLTSAVLRQIPFLDPIPEWLGRRFMEGFEWLERTGGRPSFEVPEELKQAWGLKPKK